MKNRLLIIILVSLALLVVAMAVSAAPTATTVVTDPADELQVCDQTETVEIKINDVTGMYGYQIEISYDETVVDATGAFDNSWFDTVNDAFVVDGSCTSGSCFFAVTKTNPGTPLSGSGTVATIDLDWVGSGSFDLVIEEVILTDIDGFVLPSSLPATPLAITGCTAVVTEPADELLVCDQTETVEIQINDVTDMYGYQIEVSYDETLVDATGAFDDSWFDTINDAYIVDGSCASGSCFFAVTKTNPGTPVSGSGTVATIDLDWLSGGTFDLVIEDVVLTDIDGFVIPSHLPYAPLAVTSCASVETDPADELVLCGANETVNIDINDIVGLYGYEITVSYDQSLVTASGAFDDSWFDWTGGAIPPGWNADCNAGYCQFAVAKLLPALPVDGSGTVATIELAPIDTGIFDLVIESVLLSDINGVPIPAVTPAVPLTVYVADDCGYADIYGYVELQGRVSPLGNVDEGNVTFIDNGGNFPNTVTIFSDSDGAYNATVPVLLGGSSYRFEAAHLLYLTNELDPVSLTDGDLYPAATTELRGGDANNDGWINILDISCIGNAYEVGSDCSGQGSTDITADGFTNILDLSITGGNYEKSNYLPW